MSAAIRSRSFITVFVVYLMINLGLEFGETLVSPLAASLGAAPVLIGMVATGFTYGSMFFRLVAGSAIDAFDRRKLLLIAVTILAISFFGDAFATSVPVLMCFRVLQGIGQAFTAPICLTLAAGSVTKDNIASGIGLLSVARGVATLCGPYVALRIQSATSYRFTFILAMCIEMATLLAVLNLQVKRSETKKFRLSLSGFVAREAIPPALMQFLFMMAWSCVFGFLVVYGQEQGLGSNVGLFNTVYGLMIFVSAPLGGKLVDRFGFYMMVPMLVLMSLSLWLISFSSSLWMLLLAAVVGAFGYGAAGPVVRSMAMSVVPEDRRGAASSTLFVASDLGQLIGPVIGGLWASSFGYGTMFRVAPIWVLLAAILLVLTHSYVGTKIEEHQEERQ